MFENCITVGEVKSQYVRLTIQGQDVKADYLKALEVLDGQEQTGEDGQLRTYNFKVDLEQKIIDKLAEIISLNPGDWKVEIIGLWIWVTNTKKSDKNLLNKSGAGMFFNAKRMCWQWKPYPGKASYAKTKSQDDLRVQYGSAVVVGI